MTPISDQSISQSDVVKFSDAFAMTVRSYLSINYVLAAAYFSRQVAIIEAAPDSLEFEERHLVHSAYTLGAVSHSVAFLESLINEFFLDAFEEHNYHLLLELGCPSELIPILQNLWTERQPKRQKTERLPVLDKFQLILGAAGKATFTNESFFINAQLIIDARNALIHYKPESVTTSSEIKSQPITIQEFSTLLANKFPLNPLSSNGNAFFPDQCLGHGLCEWAVNNSVDLAEEFYRRLGMKPTFHHVRSRITTR
jgi:hypothetical protein